MTRDEELKQLNEQEHKLGPRRNRAERARVILEDELFKGALEGVREGIVSAFTKCPAGDTEKLREIRLLYEALNLVVGAIGKHMRDGEVVADLLDHINTRRQAVTSAAEGRRHGGSRI
jgi:hypothetical protein